MNEAAAMSSCEPNPDGMPTLSIIVPAYNSARTLPACLKALLLAPGPSREIIVVDDASEDASITISKALGVRTLQHRVKCGAAAARNEGERQSVSPILVFVDADVVIHSDALQIIARNLIDNDECDAVFGSYDSDPGHAGLISQYRNLLHHFTHQRGNHEAETFWTGLGAVKRSAFRSANGFRCGSFVIEDVDFGLRLHDAGYRIALDPRLLGCHLKRWSLGGMVRTDIFQRAIPWAELVIKRAKFTNDLNTAATKIWSALFAGLSLLIGLASFYVHQLLALTFAGLLIALLLEIRLYRDFLHARGILFTLRAIPLHLLHQWCAGLGFALAVSKWGAAFFLTWHRKPGTDLGTSTQTVDTP